MASLSPAATDLLIGMGAGGHLIAVSNWDADRPGTVGLARVGDYRSVDRERLSELRPDVLVVQFHPDKMPAGLVDFARSIGTKIVNVQIVVLDDVFSAIRLLGDAVNAPDRAGEAERALRASLDSVRQRVAGRPPVRTYVARDETGLASVGGGNFVDDVLRAAGGVNVLSGGVNSYPTVDREQLAALDPDAILHLLPEASPQVVEAAKRFWAALPELRAVREKRVYVLTEYYVLQPSHRIGDAAARFAEHLHDLPPAPPTTAPAPAPATTSPGPATTSLAPATTAPAPATTSPSPVFEPPARSTHNTHERALRTSAPNAEVPLASSSTPFSRRPKGRARPRSAETSRITRRSPQNNPRAATLMNSPRAVAS